MAWTKKQLIQKAYSKLGYADYIYDLTPELLNAGLQTLDAMMAGWAGNGIRVGYAMVSNPDNSSIDASSGLIDAANETVYLNLAKRLSGDIGKQLSSTDMILASTGLNNLLNKVASRIAIPMQYPDSLPVGAGNKSWRETNNPFFGQPDDSLAVGPDDVLDLE